MKKIMIGLAVLFAASLVAQAVPDSKDFDLTVTTNGSSATQTITIRGEIYAVRVVSVPVGASPTATITVATPDQTIFSKAATAVGVYPLAQPLYLSTAAQAYQTFEFPSTSTGDVTRLTTNSVAVYGPYVSAGAVTATAASTSTNSGIWKIRVIYKP
jgi:hypothetical protein